MLEPVPPLPEHVAGENNEQGAGEIGRLAHEIAEAAKPLLRVADTPRGNGAHGDHRQSQTEAESTDESEAEDELFHLQADEQHGECGRAGEQAARQAEDDDLRRGDLPIHEALLNVQCVSGFVGVLVIRARRQRSVRMAMVVIMIVAVVVITMIVMMVVLAKLRRITVGLAVACQRER